MKRKHWGKTFIYLFNLYLPTGQFISYKQLKIMRTINEIIDKTSKLQC